MDDHQPDLADMNAEGVAADIAVMPGGPELSSDRISDSSADGGEDEELDPRWMGTAIDEFLPVPSGIRSDVLRRMWPATMRLAQLIVLKSLPPHLRSTLSKEELFTRFKKKWDDGELLEYIQQLDRAAVAERDAVVSTYIPWCPVKPGMVLDDELRALIPATGSAPARTDAVQFKPTVPTPDTYSGPTSTDKLAALKGIAEWVESIEGIADLLSLPAGKRIPWAVRFLRADAQSWWNGWPDAGTCHDFAALREGLTHRFVGVDPFELLCADLRKKTLVSFPAYDGFKAWWVQTVASMRAFAAAGRMWPDTVLVDQLLLALRGTFYHESVVVDPDTRQRPHTLDEALRLMDDRHRVLQIRNQAHGQFPKSTPSGDIPQAATRSAGRRRGGRDRGTPSKTADGGDNRKRSADRHAQERQMQDKKARGAYKPKAEYLAEKYRVDVPTATQRIRAGACVGCGKQPDQHQPKGKLCPPPSAN